MEIFDKFKIGFQKSAAAFTSGLKEIIVKKELDLFHLLNLYWGQFFFQK